MFRLRLIVAASILAASALVVPSGLAGAEPTDEPQLTAYLDGRPIPLADVSKYFCDDFSFPTIQCSSSRLAIEVRATLTSVLASVDYVTIYDLAYYAGSYMNVSQDYSVLALIGWNDKVSSYKARNGETGRFWTDWFNGGTSWTFCCNFQVPSLGTYDNTFSSVVRT